MPVLELIDLAVPVASGKRPMKHAIYRLGPKTGQLLAWIGVFLIFIPKMNIISLQADGAGVRLDDVLLFSLLAILAAAVLCFGDLRLRKIEAIFASWVALMVLSNAVNVVFYGRSNVLYSLRFIEYFLFFYFGYYFAKRYSLRNLAKAVLWVNAPIMILQQLGIIGGFASAGYVPGVERRHWANRRPLGGWRTHQFLLCHPHLRQEIRCMAVPPDHIAATPDRLPYGDACQSGSAPDLLL